jgi:hypothetical protein
MSMPREEHRRYANERDMILQGERFANWYGTTESMVFRVAGNRA